MLVVSNPLQPVYKPCRLLYRYREEYAQLILLYHIVLIKFRLYHARHAGTYLPQPLFIFQGFLFLAVQTPFDLFDILGRWHHFRPDAAFDQHSTDGEVIINVFFFDRRLPL